MVRPPSSPRTEAIGEKELDGPERISHDGKTNSRTSKIMKTILTFLVVPVLAFSLTSFAVGADADAGKKKRDPNAERTVKGQACCAKCCLKTAEKCANVITTTRTDKDGKEQEVTFWLADQEQHDELFCKGKTEVIAKGTVKREGKGKDAKMVLTPSSVKKVKAKS
jgi:hypothetical protein